MKPTVGRKVHYWPRPEEGIQRQCGAPQPFDATVVFSWCDGPASMVNLHILDHEGRSFNRTSVPSCPAEAPTAGYWSWMPSQVASNPAAQASPAGIMDRVAALEQRVGVLASFP